MVRPSKVGSFQFLRIGLGVTILLAGLWIFLFSNWTTYINSVSVIVHRTSPSPLNRFSPTSILKVTSTTSKANEPDTENLLEEESEGATQSIAPHLPSSSTQNVISEAIPEVLPKCPDSPPKLVGPLAVSFESPSFEQIKELNPLLRPGGVYRPPDCIPNNGATAIIIPYRNREEQLRAFLHHMHPILQRQLLEYRIIIVEQAGEGRFNRALLMNIGYKESLKLVSDNINGSQFQCYIFHDVDLIPEDDRGIYTCKDKAIHLSGYIDKFGYKIPYGAIFGGASAIPRQHFELINGFSNVYFGWGGEDDDVHDRLIHLKLPIMRYEKDVLRYRMIKHGHESTNKANDNRMALLRKTVSRMHSDGINSLKYKLIQRDDFPTYTKVRVEFTEAEVYTAVFGQPNVQL